jgi:hypothetical protein
MTARSWVDDEPRAGAYVRQAVALLLRGLNRPTRLLVAAALFTAIVVGATAFAKRTYAPHYVLRVVETDRDPESLPRPRRQLADYVRQGVFTSKPLLELIHRYGLYSSLSQKNPRAALDSFREDIDIEVYRNYFVEERSADTPPRSARLSVSYSGPSRDVAVGVTRDLGALIVQHEIAVRRDQSARAAEYAKREVDLAREALLSRRAAMTSKRAEFEQAAGREPKLQVELVSLLVSLGALERRQDESERRQATLSLGASLEGSGLGMSFEVVDDASLSTGSEERNTQMMLGGMSLIFGLPLVAMAVGAFDTKRGRA